MQYLTAGTATLAHGAKHALASPCTHKGVDAAPHARPVHLFVRMAAEPPMRKRELVISASLRSPR